MLSGSQGLPERNRSLNVPYMVKAGSGSSPCVLSPQNENDFFLSTSAAATSSTGTSLSATPQEVDRESAILNSIASPLPQGDMTGALPLSSPSEEIAGQQRQSALVATRLSAAPPFCANASIDSCLDPSLPTPPDNNIFNLRLPSFNELGIAAPRTDDHNRDSSQNDGKLLIQSVLPDCITITSPIRAPRPSLRNSDSIEFDVGANTPAPYFLSSEHVDQQHNYFPLPLLGHDTQHELVDVLTPPDDEPDVKLEIRYMPPIEQLSGESTTGTGGMPMLGEGQAVAESAQGEPAGGGQGIPTITRTDASGTGEEADAPAWLEEAIRAISEWFLFQSQ